MSSDLDGASAFLGGADPAVIEQIYAQYLKDPAAVDPSWRRIFEEEEGFGGGDGAVERAVEPPAQEDRAMGLPEPRRLLLRPRSESIRTPRSRRRPSIRSVPS